jgi:hypothetical protein
VELVENMIEETSGPGSGSVREKESTSVRRAMSRRTRYVLTVRLASECRSKPSAKPPKPLALHLIRVRQLYAQDTLLRPVGRRLGHRADINFGAPSP